MTSVLIALLPSVVAILPGIASHAPLPVSGLSAGPVCGARALAFGTRSQVPRMAILDVFKGDSKQAEGVDSAFYSEELNKERVRAYKERAARINGLEDAIEELDDDALAAKTVELRSRLAQGASEEDILEEAFAVVREAAWRTLELRHYDVQLIGGMALHDGFLAQMGTGEGKTLVGTLPVYLNALSGKGALLVTVNDYLARRDSEVMGQVYEFLGLSVGLVQQGMSTAERKAAYAADITYVTNSEVPMEGHPLHTIDPPPRALPHLLRSHLNPQPPARPRPFTAP